MPSRHAGLTRLRYRIGATRQFVAGRMFEAPAVHHQPRWNMEGSLRATRRLSVLATGILASLVAEAWAQSKDAENPTPLTSNTLRGNVEATTGNQFYSFTAVPGEVTVTLTVESVPPNSNLGGDVQLLAANLRQLCTASAFSQMGAIDSKTCSTTVKTEQRLLLRLSFAYGCKGCAYRVRIDGMRGGDTAVSTPPAAAGQTATTPGPGMRTMLIRLKDGTTMQIDLAKVVDITYK